MKKHFHALLGAMLFAMLAVPVFAQHKLAGIPLITVDDFQGRAPKDAPYPIFINSRVYYRVDTVIQKSANKFQVFIKTKVDLDREASFWKSTEETTADRERLLKHEQGHFYLAHIAANKLEKALAAVTYTANWKEEIRAKFHELNREYGKMDAKYDQETLHSRDLKAQVKWDKWIRKQLE